MIQKVKCMITMIYLEEEGTKISLRAVNMVLKEEKKSKNARRKKEIPIELIEILAEEKKQKKLSDRVITEYLNRIGFDMCESGVHEILRRHYKAKGEETPKAKTKSKSKTKVAEAEVS